MNPRILFEVSTALGFRVLADPEKVRLSQKDEDMYLFYRREGDRWLCAVAKREE